MKTVRKLFYVEVAQAVLWVTLAFLGLFFFIDFVNELQNVSQQAKLGYKVPQAFLYVSLMLPARIYELMPITVLIGTIFVMARFAQSSEFTILRTSGLGPWLALRTLLLLGVVFAIFTFVVGDYASPFADKTAQLLKAQFQGNLTVGKRGAWIKERQPYSNFSVNVGAMAADTSMLDVKIYEMDNRGHMISLTAAQSGVFGPGEGWTLSQADRTEFSNNPQGLPQANRSRMESYRWPNQITAEMVSAAILKPDRMGTVDLFTYMNHLNNNGQSAQKYEIQFWKKFFYPLSCLVMVVLALPFAYLHFRSGGMATYVFGGVMAGISFVLLNNVFTDMGALRGWTPWLAASVPSLIYSFFSLSAFTWLVLRR